MLLTYATTARCRCGASLAHDDSADACWSCSAVLLGDAVPDLSPGTDDHYHRHAQLQPKEDPVLRRPCLDCGRLTIGTRCAEHTRILEQRRGSPTQRGYGAAWHRLAQAAIRAEPWCHTAGGCPYPDAGIPGVNPLTGGHAIPMAAGGPALPDVVVVQCRRCNSSQGARLLPGTGG